MSVRASGTLTWMRAQGRELAGGQRRDVDGVQVRPPGARSVQPREHWVSVSRPILIVPRALSCDRAEARKLGAPVSATILVELNAAQLAVAHGAGAASSRSALPAGRAEVGDVGGVERLDLDLGQGADVRWEVRPPKVLIVMLPIWVPGQANDRGIWLALRPPSTMVLRALIWLVVKALIWLVISPPICEGLTSAR